MLGHVSDTALVAHYRAARLTIVPSVALEGFGLITLESLACGTPTLVTNVGGLGEVPGALSADLVVPSEDVAALASRAIDFLSGARVLPSPSACRLHAEQFSWAAAVRGYETVFDVALGK